MGMKVTFTVWCLGRSRTAGFRNAPPLGTWQEYDTWDSLAELIAVNNVVFEFERVINNATGEIVAGWYRGERVF